MAGATILVVDDDVLFADTLVRALKRRGFMPSVAYDADSPIVLASQQAFDYAVVDLKLAEASGLTVVKRLAQMQPEMGIVVLTAYASIATAVEAIKLGAMQYLMKPLELDELCEVLLRGGANGDVSEAPMSVRRLEWEHIQRVLNEHDGNISAAARALNMHRRTLQRKLQKRPAKR